MIHKLKAGLILNHKIFFCTAPFGVKFLRDEKTVDYSIVNHPKGERDYLDQIQKYMIFFFFSCDYSEFLLLLRKSYEINSPKV